MDFANPHYITPDKRFIEAVVNGVVSTIPANPDNSHYAALMASGMPIADYAPPQPTKMDVNRERDRRLETYTFNGKVYQFDTGSRENITDVGTMALAAIINGSQPGDYRWADADVDFAFIALDNTPVLMDAQTAWNFSQSAAVWKKQHIYAAREIKDTSPIPANYADDSLWPIAG